MRARAIGPTHRHTTRPRGPVRRDLKLFSLPWLRMDVLDVSSLQSRSLAIASEAVANAADARFTVDARKCSSRIPCGPSLAAGEVRNGCDKRSDEVWKASLFARAMSRLSNPIHLISRREFSAALGLSAGRIEGMAGTCPVDFDASRAWEGLFSSVALPESPWATEVERAVRHWQIIFRQVESQESIKHERRVLHFRRREARHHGQRLDVRKLVEVPAEVSQHLGHMLKGAAAGEFIRGQQGRDRFEPLHVQQVLE